MIYVIGFLISIIFSAFVVNQHSYIFLLPSENRFRNWMEKKQGNKLWDGIFMTLSGLPLFLLSAFRYGIGTDYPSYVTIFVHTKSGVEHPNIESGYLLLNKVVAHFTENPQWIFIVTSFIFVFFVYWAIYDSGQDLPFVIALIFATSVFFMFNNIVRQMLASAIILFGIKFLRKKLWIVYILLVIVGASIHQSMILLLVLVPIRLLKLDYKLSLVIPGLFLLIRLFFMEPFMNILVHFEKYNYYIITGQYMEQTISDATYVIQICIFLMIFGVLFLQKRKNSIVSDETIRMDRVFIFMQAFVLATCIFDGVFPAMYRFIRIFSFAQIIYIPYFINKFDSKWIRILLKCLVLAGFLYICIKQVFIWGAEEVVPYISIFSV